MLLRPLIVSALALTAAAATASVGSVIFIHPDGTGANSWGAARMRWVGPDGNLNWDLLPNIAVYRGHMKDALAGTSNGGAVTHAHGVKVPSNNAGLDNGRPVMALSGKRQSILREAKAAGLATGIVNTASITDAGSGLFVANVRSRRDHTEIARQILQVAPEVILGGGEQWFLPKGTRGRHGEGERTDGRNLIQEFRRKGYTVVFTRDELNRLPAGTRRVLGLFAADDTFNDRTEEELRQAKLPMFQTQAPSVREMTRAALRVLGANRKRFFLVAEEEATDNFGGALNAPGTLEALRRADGALGEARAFVARNPRTLLLTTADSDAGGMQVMGDVEIDPNKPLPEKTENGSPLDGRDGTGTLPFLAPADRFGKRLPFGICWANDGDLSGGILVRATGLNASLVRGSMDNTDVYRVMYRTLFGRMPGTRR